MRLPWRTSKSQQLDLLDDVPVDDSLSSTQEVRDQPGARSVKGRPATVPIESIDEDPANPRADFPDVALDELAEDIHLRGILVPLVVHPINADGRHLLHFGARRLRAALRAGLREVPVVVRDAPADRYAQVAENLKRADLAPLDLARFIRQQMDAGDSQAEVSRRLSMNLTTVAHHLSLLDLPPALADAMKSGRCTSPRTLHELTKLHDQQPEAVRSLVDGKRPITRDTVAALRTETKASGPASTTRWLHQAHAACERLERLLVRLKASADAPSLADLAALRARFTALSEHLLQESDRQTPSQAKP